MKFHEARLANGLTVVAEINDQAHSISAGYFVRTGARDETVEESGLSHFLEHMLFKGTERRDALSVNRDFDRVGARHNAQTSEEDTIYHVTALPEYMPAAFDVLSDIMRPVLREEDFDTEKLVIVEEIKMYDDNPMMVAYESAKEAHFGRHPLGQSVLGTVDSIMAMRVEQMRDYFRRQYAPNNLVLAFTGNGDWSQLLDMAKKHCESWEPAETASRNTPESTGQGGYRAVERADDQQQTMVLVGAAPSLEDPLRYAAGLLATALGDASGSRLYWEIVHPGHAEMCDLSYQEYNHAGAYFLFLGCDPDNSEANLDRVSHVLHRIRETGLNQSEIDRARNKTLSRAMIRAERPMGRLMPLGGYYTYFNRYVSLDEDVTAYQSVTVDHVRQVLDRYPLRPLTLSTVGPRTDLKIVD
jgi:predicted Zn-dependent peptidase